MGFLDSLKNWFRGEAAEVKATVSDVERKLDADISRREREMAMTPEEKMAAIQDEISNDPFSEARDKIEGAESKALADEELAGLDPTTATEPPSEPTGGATRPIYAAEDRERDLAAAEETLNRADQASRAEEILRNLNKEVRGES